MKEGEIRYDCVENDNHICAMVVDGEIEEVWFGCGDGEHLIYGFKDVKSALETFTKALAG